RAHGRHPGDELPRRRGGARLGARPARGACPGAARERAPAGAPGALPARGGGELHGLRVALEGPARGPGRAASPRRAGRLPRRGAGLVTALARSSGLTRLAFVRQQMDVLGAAEEEAARLIAQPRRIARAFALGLLANLLVLAEYALLLAAFGLPSGPVAVVAA